MSETNSNLMQEAFIEMLRTALPPNHSLVNELSDLLDISTDSSYRRIRCETEFTLSEIVKLSGHFHISFDGLCAAETGTVHFRYNLLDQKPESLRKYLESIRNDLRHIHDARERNVIYAAEDIPLFYLFLVPGLAHFKFFYWMKSVLNVPELENMKYKPEFASDLIGDLGKEILDLYMGVPSVEIWNDTTISSLLKQIEFYHESGLFNTTGEAMQVCEDLLSLLGHIQKMAETSSKSGKEGVARNFTLYNSDVDIGNICILAKAGKSRFVFIRHSTFNTLVTSNPVFCSETEQWLEGLLIKSTLISGVSEKHRNRFFRTISTRVGKLNEKISQQ
ncbi:MAG: hypothetical protein V2A54_07535 [Bacteroidota bacterium]